MSEERTAITNRIFGKFLSVKDWKKNYKELIIMFLIALWRITAARVDIEEMRTETALHDLKNCNEGRLQDLKQSDSSKQKWIDLKFEEAMIKSREKYIQPKIDSIANL